MRVVVLLITSVFFLGNLWASDLLSHEEKIADIDQLLGTVRSSYGPRDYKAERLGLNIEHLREKYVVLSQKTNDGEFYYLLLQLIAEFQDSHFGARVPTQRESTLGFMTDLVEGKVLIDEIMRDLLPEDEFNFARGDEIVAVDGILAEGLITELSSYRGMGALETKMRVGAMLVATRPGMTLPIGRGISIVQIRRGTSDIIETVPLTWFHRGEGLDEDTVEEGEKINLTTTRVKSPFHLEDFELSVRPTLEDLIPNLEKSYACSGKTRIAIPKDATVLMEEPFVAYYYPTERGNVGYLRIPHYYPRDDQNEPAFEERFAQYVWAVTKLEENSVGLIIDQDHNCGGSVDYLEKMVGLFVRQEFRPLEFQFLASKSEYLSFRGWLEELPDHILEKEYFGQTVELLKKHWLLGDFLTPKTTFFGNQKLKPYPHGYTKPIVMLIDEMSGSGGDAFPAMLQGNGRAVLLGTRTMGAGGHVVEMPPLHHSGIAPRMTKSLFYRPDGVAVENNGAVPDIPYTITRDDFLYEYKGYQRFYTEKLLGLITE